MMVTLPFAGVQVDLESLVITNICDSYGGAAWCLASCPRSSILAVGGEDGELSLTDY
jgi:hypothetical protein